MGYIGEMQKFEKRTKVLEQDKRYVPYREMQKFENRTKELEQEKSVITEQKIWAIWGNDEERQTRNKYKVLSSLMHPILNAVKYYDTNTLLYRVINQTV
jgi:hypothetical protein